MSVESNARPYLLTSSIYTEIYFIFRTLLPQLDSLINMHGYHIQVFYRAVIVQLCDQYRT